MIRRLDRMLFRKFLPIFVFALLFCILLLLLVDLFEHLIGYVERNVPVQAIVRQILLFLPQAFVWSFPLALLFSVSFSMGELYSRNELISIFGAGRRLGRFLMPLFLFGILSGIMLFWVEDALVIESSRTKEMEQRSLLGAGVVGGANTTISSDGGQLVFFTQYYARGTDTMERLTVVERTEDGSLLRRTSARRAQWNGQTWDLEDGIQFEWTEDGDVVSREFDRFTDPGFDIEPEVFRRGSQSVDDMRIHEARQFIARRAAAGLPYRQARTDFLRRYAFAATPLIVTIFAGAVGSRLKRSILLISVLLSMSLAVVYYTVQFVASMLARFGYIEPEVGAFLPVLLFFILALGMLSRART